MSEVAAENAPKPILVQSMQNIMKLPVERGNDWNVYAYAINKDVIVDGKIDPLRALVFPLGSFYDEDAADKHAKYIMEKTQHPHIVIAQYGMPIKITTTPDSNKVNRVTMDLKGKIIEMESKEHQELLEAYEKKLQFEKDLLIETDKEMNVDDLEHYKRYAYLCTKNYSNYLELKKQSEQMLKEFEQNKKILKEHLVHHPEHEEQFLPMFKDKLLGRGEEELYLRIEATYNKYKEFILN